MNYFEGGHARIELGKPSGILIPLFIKGCYIISSSVNLLAIKNEKFIDVSYRDQALIILRLKILPNL